LYTYLTSGLAILLISALALPGCSTQNETGEQSKATPPPPQGSVTKPLHKEVGEAVDLTASIGLAVYRNDGQDCSDLIKQADTAMYLAKAYSVPIQSFETAMQM